MKRFQFPLQRVFEWRSLQMRAAEVKAAMGLLKLPTMDGSDLQSLAAFQLRMRSQRAELHAARARCQAEIVQQRTRVLIARRDFRVLEKLKEKRLQSWTYLTDREIENTAADAFLSRWARPDAME